MPKTPLESPTINDLYPELTPEEQADAAWRLSRYLTIVRGIFERTGGLTERDGSHKLK